MAYAEWMYLSINFSKAWRKHIFACCSPIRNSSRHFKSIYIMSSYKYYVYFVITSIEVSTHTRLVIFCIKTHINWQAMLWIQADPWIHTEWILSLMVRLLYLINTKFKVLKPSPSVCLSHTLAPLRFSVSPVPCFTHSIICSSNSMWVIILLNFSLKSLF